MALFPASGGIPNLGSPDLCDGYIFESTDTDITKAIPVDKKPRYVVVAFSSLVNGNNSVFATYADGVHNNSKTIGFTGGGAKLIYNTISGMQSDSALNGAGLVSVSNNAVTIKGQSGYRCEITYAIYY